MTVHLLLSPDFRRHTRHSIGRRGSRKVPDSQERPPAGRRHPSIACLILPDYQQAVRKRRH